MVVMPGDDGYHQIAKLAEDLPQTGIGARRVITSMNQLRDSWPACPLLAVADPEVAIV